MTPERPEPGGMPQLCVRLTGRMLGQLDALAGERGITRTRVVRQLLEPGLRDRPAPASEPPTEEELVALLAERARSGNVSAIRSLLAREHTTDPRERALGLCSRTWFGSGSHERAGARGVHGPGGGAVAGRGGAGSAGAARERRSGGAGAVPARLRRAV
jgi:hypothetical protein